MSGAIAIAMDLALIAAILFHVACSGYPFPTTCKPLSLGQATTMPNEMELLTHDEQEMLRQHHAGEPGLGYTPQGQVYGVDGLTWGSVCCGQQGQ